MRETLYRLLCMAWWVILALALCTAVAITSWIVMVLA